MKTTSTVSEHSIPDAAVASLDLNTVLNEMSTKTELQNADLVRELNGIAPGLGDKVMSAAKAEARREKRQGRNVDNRITELVVYGALLDEKARQGELAATTGDDVSRAVVRIDGLVRDMIQTNIRALKFLSRADAIDARIKEREIPTKVQRSHRTSLASVGHTAGGIGRTARR